MVSDDRIDGYASAIFEIARSEGELEQVGDELYRIARAFESSPELRDVLTDRRVATERKQAVLGELLDGKAAPLTVALVNFVVSVERGGDLPAIADRLAAKAAGERNAVIAEVRSAIELDEATVAKLASSLSAATGKQVEVKTVLDPAVLGGVVARIGDTVIDGSLRNRLESLRDKLNQ
jgi:F-type H+-transporting ATPase subunit delta